MESEHQVPIWFFIGSLAAGLRDHHRGGGHLRPGLPPPVDHRVALFELHADLWWGLLLVVLGTFYTVRFHPSAQAELIAARRPFLIGYHLKPICR